MNDVDHYYLPRHDQDKLVAILALLHTDSNFPPARHGEAS